jgi:uroporphyrinogen III methyltransferase/synthase
VTVYLVGAGPGDPGLITVRGLELLRRADVLVYDRLAGPRLLAEAPSGCELVYAGKRPDHHAMTQDEINAALVRWGRDGGTVVRLKGGDPFVFGRGSEEAQALRAAGVDYEVVPGITSAIAVPAYAGVPVTHRGTSTHFTVVTGHEDPGKGRSDVDWAALARAGGTLVLLMAVGRLPAIAEALQGGGLSPSTPVAVIASGTLPEQATVTATLGTIGEAAAAVRPPAVTVIGDVASLRDEIAWLERRPLHGLRVAVTRARSQAAGLATRLHELGATVIESPVIRVEPIDGAHIDPSRYDAICLTSPNAPRLLLDRIGGDGRRLAGVELAAIGPGTAGALREVGLVPDLIAERAVAEGLLTALDGRVDGRRFLLAQAEGARPTLAAGLREAGAAVVDVEPLYRTLPERPSGADALTADLVTFTSASTVHAFADAYPEADLGALRGVSIGPVTSAAARELGVRLVAEAERHDLDGLVEAVVAAARGGPR